MKSFLRFIIVVSVLVFSFNGHSLFDDKIIEPYLGPYKLLKNKTKNCPKRLILMASCSLGELSLRNVENPDFNFLNLSGVNEGIIVSKIGGQTIEKIKSTFKDLELLSNKKSYVKRYKKWFESEIRLILKKKRFILQKTSITPKNNLSLYCEYVFDEKENEKIQRSLP